MGPTTQVFKAVVKAVVEPPAVAAPMQPGMTLAQGAEQITTWTFNSDDRFISVGPLDREKFQDGDQVKVIVQRVGKRGD